MSWPRCRRAAATSARGVLVDARRRVLRHVAHAQAAAEVVDGELAQRGQRRDLGLELVEVEDLRADVGVQALQVDQRVVPHALDGGRHLVHGHAELGAGAAGGQRRVSGRVDAGAGPQQHRGAGAGQPRDAVDVVEPVDHDVADARVQGGPDVVVGLGVAVHDDLRRVDAGGQGQAQLARPDHVTAQALLGQDLDDRRGREGLGREADPAARMPAGEGADVLARPGPQVILVEHVHRGPELAGQLAQRDAGDAQVVAVRGGGRRQQ